MIKIQSVLVHEATCTDCSQRHSDMDLRSAQDWADEHMEMHERFKRAGQQLLQSEVMNTDEVDGQWFGVWDAAVLYAQEKGFPYLTWNGNVRRSELGVLHLEPVCRTEDVPFLRKSWTSYNRKKVQ